MGRNSNQDGSQLPFALCPHAYNIRLNNLVGESDEASLCPRGGRNRATDDTERNDGSLISRTMYFIKR